MQILGLLAILADGYFGFLVGAMMSQQDQTLGIILLSVAVGTRLVFIVEEAFVTHFNWVPYSLAIPICFVDVAGVIVGECLEMAIVITTFTGVSLLLLPPAIRILKQIS